MVTARRTFKQLFLCCLFHLVFPMPWSYSEPEDWPGSCNVGTRQSPIDLGDGAVGKQFSGWSFSGFYHPMQKAMMTNNGHSAVVTFDHPIQAAWTGGGFKDNFRFAQLHFHWGAKDTRGSEHTVYGASYPLELHLVHYNLKYGTDLATAVGSGQRDALAVLGVLFHVQEKDNEDFEEIINGLEKIKKVGDETSIGDFVLEDLLPMNRGSFWRYEGSLTTPNCNEIVQWTVFKNTVGISSSQLSQFRRLTWVDSDGNSLPLVDNYRSPQPLNGRTLYEASAKRKTYMQCEYS